MDPLSISGSVIGAIQAATTAVRAWSAFKRGTPAGSRFEEETEKILSLHRDMFQILESLSESIETSPGLLNSEGYDNLAIAIQSYTEVSAWTQKILEDRPAFYKRALGNRPTHLQEIIQKLEMSKISLQLLLQFTQVAS